MSYVHSRSARIGKLDERVELGLAARLLLVKRVEDSGVRPSVLPLFFNTEIIVFHESVSCVSCVFSFVSTPSSEEISVVVP